MRRWGSINSVLVCMELQHSAGVRARARGRMPFSSLNQVQMDLPTAMSSAWQRWIGLPEGALLWLRSGDLTSLSSHLPQIQSVSTSFVSGQRARLLADRTHFATFRKAGFIRPGLRSFRRRSASCRSAFPVLLQRRFRPVQRPGKGRHGNLAGCFFSPGNNISNIPRVGRD